MAREIDWASSMEQTFEYYIVDPGTWKDVKLLNTVIGCTINRDSSTDTLGSASIDINDLVGECYIRTYLIAIQNGVRYKIPLGTHIVQTPSSSFDGMVRKVSMDAYTPLIELKENPVPIGYYVGKNENIMDNVYSIVRDNVRAPVVKPSCSETVYSDFVAETDENWLSFASSLATNAKYNLDLDELGRILFSPKQELDAMQPVWVFDDNNSSILYPEITLDHDIYGIPNVVEVIYSNGRETFNARVVNDDVNSPISTVNRGREIIHRITDVSALGNPNSDQINEYAEEVLKELSSIEYTLSYTHGYCPVRIGDCVRLNYKKAGLTGIKAKVISQSIKCEQGCSVTEKAVFSKKLWR